MLKKLIDRVRSAARKNLNRHRARRAIRRGMFKGIDRGAMEKLRANFDGHHCRKYHDKFEHSLVRNAERVFLLRLDESRGRRILDLGCGFGYFLYAARHLGHLGVGLDVDDPYLGQVTRLLGLDKVIHRIEPTQPLPDIPGGPFDLITAFATVFDHSGFDGQWGVKEWRYFLKDLSRFMAPGCLLHIKFNQYTGPGCQSGSACRAVPTELWEFFHSLGARFDKRTMQINDAPSRIREGGEANLPRS